jgi:hypothetical protein
LDGICISCEVPSIADTTHIRTKLFILPPDWDVELIEVKSLIWAQKGKLYIIYEKVV